MNSEKQFYALVTTEAYGGCGVVVNADEDWKPGLKCLVEIGKLSPLVAEVAWVRPIDEEIVRVGFRYLE